MNISINSDLSLNFFRMVVKKARGFEPAYEEVDYVQEAIKVYLEKEGPYSLIIKRDREHGLQLEGKEPYRKTRI